MGLRLHLVLLLLAVLRACLLQEALLTSENRDLPKNLAQLPEDLLDLLHVLRVLAQDPEHPAVHLARLDLGQGLDEFVADGATQLWELLDDLAHEGDDVERGGVVRVAEEVHERVHDAGGHLGELDRAYVNRLDEQLPVLGGLYFG